MKISYLFSNNAKIGSKIISYFSGLLVKDLEKIPSHMAVLIEKEGYEALVFESTFASGVRILPYKKWLELNNECYKITCPKNFNAEQIFSVVNQCWGKKYDWFGIAFFIPCFLGALLFNIPFPKDNKWQCKNRYFCNELGGILADYPKYSMVTPAKMCVDFLKMEKKHGTLR